MSAITCAYFAFIYSRVYRLQRLNGALLLHHYYIFFFLCFSSRTRIVFAFVWNTTFRFRLQEQIKIVSFELCVWFNGTRNNFWTDSCILLFFLVSIFLRLSGFREGFFRNENYVIELVLIIRYFIRLLLLLILNFHVHWECKFDFRLCSSLFTYVYISEFTYFPILQN